MVLLLCCNDLFSNLIPYAASIYYTIFEDNDSIFLALWKFTVLFIFFQLLTVSNCIVLLSLLYYDSNSLVTFS